MMQLKSATRTELISPFYVMAVLNRAKQLQAQGRDIIHLEIGEPDFPTSDSIIQAGIRQLKSGQIKYTPAAGLPELRQQIAEFYWQRYQVRINSQRIFITPGASGALLLALSASLNPGDELLLADPGYPCNSNFAHLLAVKPKLIPVTTSSAYQLTAQAIQAAWTAQSKGVLIASPSNPTGTIISSEQLTACINTTQALNGVFFSDEIYHGLSYGEDCVSALQISDDVFVINSFSKYFGMTGWRIGWLIVPEAAIEAVEKLTQNIFIATSTNSQHAALAAFLPETLAELELRRSELQTRRDYLYNALIELGFDIPIKPNGAFYIYANASRFTDDSLQFALDLLEQQGVAITPGKDFGQYNAEQHLRFAYTTSIARMSDAIQRIHTFIKQG